MKDPWELGTFEQKVAEEIREIFRRAGVRARFIRRGYDPELFRIFSHDKKAKELLIAYAERKAKETAVQMMLPLAE